MSKTTNRFSPEVRERAVRLVLDNQGKHGSPWQAVLFHAGGLASRSELLEAYLAAGGRPTGQLDWYLALACLKLGVVIEGTWARYLAGRATREAGERLHSSAVTLMQMGTAVAAGDNPFH